MYGLPMEGTGGLPSIFHKWSGGAMGARCAERRPPCRWRQISASWLFQNARKMWLHHRGTGRAPGNWLGKIKFPLTNRGRCAILPPKTKKVGCIRLTSSTGEEVYMVPTTQQWVFVVVLTDAFASVVLFLSEQICMCRNMD